MEAAAIETGSHLFDKERAFRLPLGKVIIWKKNLTDVGLRVRLAHQYRNVAVIFLNVALLLILVNITIALGLAATRLVTSGSTGSTVPMKYKEFHPSLAAVYPDLTQDEITKVTIDTRRVPQVYDPYTQFKEPAYQSGYVNVSSNGFRVSRKQGPWPPAKSYRSVFMFGGSTTFGYGVPDHQTIPAYLQEVLEAKTGIQVRVYNFGRCSYFSIQERILLEKLLLDGFVPDMVVFMDGLNDFIFASGEPGYTKELAEFMTQRDIPLTRRIALELPMTRPFLSGWNSAATMGRPAKGMASQPRIEENELLRGVVKRYRTNKEIVESICRGFNISPVFVWQPTPLYGYDQKYHIFAQFGYDEFSPHVAQGYRLMAQVVKSESLGDNFVWLADMQESLKEPLYVDAFHYSAKMCKRIAEHIGTAAVERGMLQRKLSSNSQPNS